MFGFTDNPASVDWSFYGGAEELPPRAQGAASASTSSSPARPSHLVAMSRSWSSSTSGVRSSRSASSASDSDSPAETTTPATSDDEVDVSLEDEQSSKPGESSSTSLRQRRTAGKAAELKPPAGAPWLPKVSETPQDETDFLWLLTEEPHRSRRQAIMKAHPEVKRLMGHEPLTKWLSLGVVLLQLGMAVAVSQAQLHPLDWRFLLLAYAVGGTANQNLFLAIHEITHNLAFKGIRANKLWAILSNVPIGVPYAMMFKRYHIEHHKFLGEDGIDTDLPTRLELMCLKNVLGKAFFATFQIFFYALRPGFVRAQALTRWHLLNMGAQLAFDYVLVKACGWTALIYLLESSFFAGSLHPCAAHFIAEHYLFGGIQQETWSYYGPLNALCYNVGYHNEHHDFPSVPWTRLPALRAMAPEFYDCLPSHKSWPLVTLQFILGTDSGLFARIKRRSEKEDTSISTE